jgi:hypothetical protein
MSARYLPGETAPRANPSTTCDTVEPVDGAAAERRGGLELVDSAVAAMRIVVAALRRVA